MAASSPATFGRRYAPLLILAAVHLLVMVLAPSLPNKGDTRLASGSTTGRTIRNADGTVVDPVTGEVLSADGVPLDPATGAAIAGSSGPAGAGAATAAGPGGTATGGAGPQAPGAGDLRNCAKNGQQVGPTFYMPKCRPVFSGDNGGATMTGVTPTEIRFVFVRSKGDATVNQILGTQGLAASTGQVCTALKAFTNTLNKRWELYGRKFVPLDGPNEHKGSTFEDCNGFPYFQSTCTLTPPDPPCTRAEADVIAAMKPAYVFCTSCTNQFHNQLGKNRIISAGAPHTPDAYHEAVQPYYYDVFMGGTRAARMMADYVCKKLANKPVKFAGFDVLHPDGNPVGPIPKRKFGISYPSTNGDPVYAQSADLFVSLVTGKECNVGEVKKYPYQSDIGTATTQSNTLAGQERADGITTIICMCDPIAPVFGTQAQANNNYHPEQLMIGTGLIDYDVLGRLYDNRTWKYAFGLSDLTNPVPFEESDAAKAFQDGGGSGLPDTTENLNWAYMSLMGSSFMNAGPRPTPQSIRDGLFTADPIGGDPVHATIFFGRPNDYTGIKDAREVYWCSTARSGIDGKPGAYVPIDGGKRHQVGAWPTGDPAAFPNGVEAPC